MKQTTINKEFRLTGLGLHTGRTVTVTVRPAPPDSYGYYLWEKSIEKPLLKILKKYGIK